MNNHYAKTGLQLTLLVNASIATGLLACTAGATDYYVSKAGSNSNSGALNQPFLTIQQAANLAQAGDNVYVMAGTYRETVTIPNSGTALAPIKFQPFEGARVTISGLDTVSSSWSPHSGSIYSATVAGGASQVFVNGQMMTGARSAGTVDNNQLIYNNPLRANYASVDSATLGAFPANSTISSASLAGAANFTGGKVAVVAGGAYVAISAPINGQTGNNLSVQWPEGYSANGGIYFPSAGNKFYVYDTLAALNANKEWYYDSAASKLYLQGPGGVSPAMQTVEVRKRELGFNLGSQSNIQVSGFQLHAAGINVAGNNNLISNVQVLYGTSFSAPAGWNSPTDPASIRVSGQNNIVQNSEIAYSWGDGVRVLGPNNTINNNLIHDVDWNATDAAFVNADGAGGNSVITNNTMYNGARSGVTYRDANPNTIIQHNDISRFGGLTKDLGGIYTFNGHNAGSVVSYNRVYDGQSDGTHAGIYTDVFSTGVTAHHNLVHDTQYGILTYREGHNYYNNTLWNVDSAMLAGNTLTDVSTVNNLANANPWLGSTVHHNRTQSSNPFVNSAAGDYTLKSGTTPVNFGTPIPGVTDGYIGSAPDVGAFELGTPAWTAGVNFKTWLFSDQSIAPLTTAVNVTQIGQRSTTGSLSVGNTSNTNLNNRSFFKFDLTGITGDFASASLRIYEGAAPTNANGDVRLLRVLSDWNAGNVSYNQSVDTASQLTGFYDPANRDLYTTIDVTSMVRSWLNNPSTNFGFSLQGSEGVLGSAKFFDGFYGVTAPQLIISRASAPPPGPESRTKLLIDFEAPAYAGAAFPGTALPGQNGWNGLIANNAAYVANSGNGALTVPLAGSQSAVVGTNTSYSFPFHPAAGAEFEDGSIFSGLVVPNAASTEFDLTATINNDTYAGVIFDAGGIVKASSGTNINIGSYVLGHLHEVSLTLDFSNQNYIVKVDDLTAVTSFTSAPIPFRINLAFNPDGLIDLLDAEGGDILIGTIGAGGAVFDNITVMSPAPLGVPGDYDENGVVDAADYVLWRKNQGTGNVLPNDPIGGQIGVGQYNQWRTNFGKSLASATSVGESLSSVPEPASLQLICILLALAFASLRTPLKISNANAFCRFQCKRLG